MRHQIQGGQKDVMVYQEKDNSNYIGVSKSKNGRYIFISSQATLSSEQFYINADEPESAFQSFQPRIKNVLYDVVALNDKFLIRTNENALNFKVMECPNCQTPWKCNGPHLLPMSDSIYESIYGYFILKNNRWIFTPLEKEFYTDDLMIIADTLRNLNQNEV
jgi:oligopeptidase B